MGNKRSSWKGYPIKVTEVLPKEGEDWPQEDF